jgi:hypothetical protein
MSVYRFVALVADLNTLPCVNTQVYQTRGVLVTKVALHIFSFLALATHKKGVFHATQGRNTPTKKAQKGGYPAAFLCVVVFVFKRSMLRLLVLFYGYGCALASLPLC